MTTHPEDAMTRERALEKALIRVAASLVAAVSLLKTGGKAAKKAAPSDRMFDQMILDYEKAIEQGRAALASAQQEPAPAADADEVSEWRPIETAPKEPHLKYLGWCEFDDPRSPDGEARIITLDYNGFPYAFGCKQTVRWWMPLPESPAARASGEKGGAK